LQIEQENNILKIEVSHLKSELECSKLNEKQKQDFIEKNLLHLKFIIEDKSVLQEIKKST